MKTLPDLPALLLVIFLVLLGCTEKKQIQLVRIKVKAEDQRNRNLKINIFQNLDQQTLAISKLDSLGYGWLEFNITKPVFATIQVGEKFSELYIEPGYDMIASTNSDPNNKVVNFVGKGSEVNNYVSRAFSIAEKIKFNDGKFINHLEIGDFVKRFDSLSLTMSAFYRHYMDSVQLPKNIQELLLEKNKIGLLAIRQEYAFLLYNNYLLEYSEATQEGQEASQFIMPTELESVTNEVPFDTTLLSLGMFEYQHLLFMYLNNKFYNPDYDFQTWEKIKYKYPLEVNGKIRNGTFSSGIMEYLVARDIHYWLGMQGITIANDSTLNRFKKDFKESRYLPVLQRDYNEWLAIAPGNLAPEFSGTTLDEKKISLTDLRGKIVYVDVWATWCAPCIEEIPESKKLIASFEGNDGVEFLNVSIDRNFDAWKKFILGDKEWKGTHINQQKDQIDSFWRAYKMAGVPTYILIDQNGRIVDAKASRPSEGKIKKQIESLLGNTL
jgi:thiol-disulfide isomerase/thioredoxin